MHPLPGIWSGFEVNTAITLPIGVETYAAYALRVWLSGRVPHRHAASPAPPPWARSDSARSARSPTTS
ncbi:hypothetical protein GCM10020366_00030 [Saccharopolyspora gregorii]|uniref:Uncharacterized protein n=1 Tax=Saccharopolyspora gregorii TaxID=33914 RepID=A0ABP6RJE4_9PSEU